MKLRNLRIVGTLLRIASAAPAGKDAKRAATPKVYLAGDSTMALGGGGAQTQGSTLLDLYFG